MADKHEFNVRFYQILTPAFLLDRTFKVAFLLTGMAFCLKSIEK